MIKKIKLILLSMLRFYLDVMYIEFFKNVFKKFKKFLYKKGLYIDR